MLFDTHAHLDQEDFDADRDDVVRRAAEAGVDADRGRRHDWPRPAGGASSWPMQFPGVLAAVGIQPNYTAQVEAGRLGPGGRAGRKTRGWWPWARRGSIATGTMRRWRCSRTFSIGICGCRKQRSLPFIVHTRESDAEVLAMLREARTRGPLSGVMHSFTGTAETAAECVELGLWISFAGMVTFKKSVDLRAVAATVPADRIVIETDSPYLSPHPLRGKRNEPANLVHTAAVLAEVRGLSLDEFSRQTTANARRLFGLPEG